MRFSLHNLKRHAIWYGRRAKLLSLGSALVGIGLVFLVAAFWMFLADRFSPLVATLTLAAVFVSAGLGILVFLPQPPRDPIFASSRSARQNQAAEANATPSAEQVDALMEAFFFGVELHDRFRMRQTRRKDRQAHE